MLKIIKILVPPNKIVAIKYSLKVDFLLIIYYNIYGSYFKYLHPRFHSEPGQIVIEAALNFLQLVGGGT